MTVNDIISLTPNQIVNLPDVELVRYSRFAATVANRRLSALKNAGFGESPATADLSSRTIKRGFSVPSTSSSRMVLRNSLTRSTRFLANPLSTVTNAKKWKKSFSSEFVKAAKKAAGYDENRKIPFTSTGDKKMDDIVFKIANRLLYTKKYRVAKEGLPSNRVFNLTADIVDNFESFKNQDGSPAIRITRKGSPNHLDVYRVLKILAENEESTGIGYGERSFSDFFEDDDGGSWGETIFL